MYLALDPYLFFDLQKISNLRQCILALDPYLFFVLQKIKISNLRQTTYFPHLKIYLGPFLDGDTLFEKGPYVPPAIMTK
jgi:hypothetical protein